MKGVNLLIVLGLLVSILVFYGCGKKVRLEETGHLREHGTTMAEHREVLSGGVINGVREIRLAAFQFGFAPEVIVVKKGDKVKVIARSRDVKHGIRIEGFNINQVLPPNEEKVIEFVADTTGEFHFRCSVYCGAGHRKMRGTSVVKE